MIYFAIFLVELFVLWRLSRVINSRFYNSLPFGLYAVLFLPGTFIHELSHFLMAKLLFVPVGKFTIRPQKYEKEVVLGSVSIAGVDIMRRLVIGAAPVIFGLFLVMATIYLVIANNLIRDTRIAILVSYVVFIVGNTMFSSKKDMEGAWKVAISSSVIFFIFYLLGIRFYLNFESAFFARIIEVVKLMNLYLLAPIAIDALISACYLLKNKIF